MLQAIERARWVGGKQSTRSVCTIDMEPDAALGADRADSFEIVEGTSRRRAGRRHHRHGALAFVPQAIEGRQQDIHIQLVIARADRDSASLSQPQLSDCARYRIMRVLAVNDERWIGTHALLERVGQRCVPRGQHRREVCFGASRCECASGACAVTGESGHPLDNLVLDRGPGRRHLRDGKRLIEGADDALHPDSNSQRRGSLMPHVHRVVILVGIL